MARSFYDPVQNRWVNYYDPLVSHANSVFREGFDDPTYMTFKIEFGDWGASVLDRATLNLGITNFNAIQSDYDQLPIGLLNCPYPKQTYDQTIWQTGASGDASIFNNNVNYSAFTYLRSRNEDVRAEYLYYFVNGLFEIQQNTPYLFQKISGIDQLDQFNPTQGQRLKDAKITLECIEGLDLKMKSLMEYYRKAAWDDVYQRWILPENMREFKMIIYVFERRTFQTPDFSLDELNYDIPVKAYECSPCEFQISNWWKGDYDANGSDEAVSTQITINVKNVKTFYSNGLMNGHLDLIYKSSGQNNRNIQTKINKMLVYDLIESCDKQLSVTNLGNENLNVDNITDSSSSLNAVRKRFMSKRVFLSNENFAGIGDTRRTWITTLVKGPSWNKNKSIWQNIGANLKNLLLGARRQVLVGSDANLVQDMISNDIMHFMFHDNDLPDRVSAAIPENYDRKVAVQNLKGMMVTVDGIIDPRINSRQPRRSKATESDTADKQSISSKFLKLLKERDSVGVVPVSMAKEKRAAMADNMGSLYEHSYISDKASETAIGSDADTKILSGQSKDIATANRPYAENYAKQHTIGMNLESPMIHADLYEGNEYVTNKAAEEHIGEETSMIVNSTDCHLNDSSETTLLTLEKSRDINAQAMTKLDDPREIANGKMSKLDVPRIVNAQAFIKMDRPRQIDNAELAELEDPRQTFDGEMPELENPRNIPVSPFNALDDPRNIVDQEMSRLNESRQIDNANMSELEKARQIDDAEMVPLTGKRSIVPITDISLESRIPVDSQMTELEDSRMPDSYDMPSLEDPRELVLQQMSELVGPRMLQDAKMSGLEESRSIDKVQMHPLEEPKSSEQLPLAEMIEDVKHEHNQHMQQLEDPSEPVHSDMYSLEEPAEHISSISQQPLFDDTPITYQQFLELDSPRDVEQQPMPKLETPERPQSQPMAKLIEIIRQIPSMENFTLEDARQLPEQQLIGLEKLQKEIQPTMQVSRLELIDMISKATEQPSSGFLTMDDNVKKNEKAAIDNLKDNTALMSLNFGNDDKAENRKLSIAKMAKVLAENSDDIQSELSTHIIGVKKDLQKLSEDAVRKLPEVKMYTLESPTEKAKDEVLISLQDVKQLDKNIKLIGLEDDVIRDMSMTTLITLNETMEEETKNTQAMIGLTDEVETKKNDTLLQLEKEQPRKKLGKDDMLQIEEPNKKENTKIIY